MAIKVVKDPDDMPPDIRAVKEHCAICFAGTTTWCAEKDVAVCADCAGKIDLSDVPTKKVWWETVIAKFPYLRTNP